MTMLGTLSRLAAAGASLVAAATVVVYAEVISSESDGLAQSEGQPYLWIAVMTVPVLASAAAVVAPARVRLVLLGIAVLVLAPLGVVAIFSVGLGFLAASAFATAGAALASYGSARGLTGPASDRGPAQW